MLLVLCLALIAGYTDVLAYPAQHMWLANMSGMLLFLAVVTVRRSSAS